MTPTTVLPARGAGLPARYSTDRADPVAITDSSPATAARPARKKLGAENVNGAAPESVAVVGGTPDTHKTKMTPVTGRRKTVSSSQLWRQFFLRLDQLSCELYRPWSYRMDTNAAGMHHGQR